MSTVRTILQQKRLSLLQSLPRSALVTYQPDSRSGVSLVHVPAQSTFHDLVIEGKTFRFEASPSRADPRSTGPGDAVSAEEPAFLTPYSPSQLLSRLIATYLRSRRSMEDYGETVLYLTFCTLQGGDSDRTEGVLHAPLFLIPVVLSRESVRAPILLRATGEDPLLNPALRVVLSRDYGLELPYWSVYQADGISRCLEQIESVIKTKDGWHVDERAACIDLFDVSTVLNYLDLDPDYQVRNDLDNHRVLQALLHEGFDATDLDIENDASIDMLVEPGQLPFVIPANNEQLLALYSIKKGADCVIEGPGQTGKTQTLANLVAAAMAEEKHVLVLSNKVEALDDVRERLHATGLGALVLPLYGEHLSRQRLLRQLQHIHSFTDRTPEDESVSVDTLVRLRNKLNIYNNSLHTPIRDSGVSPYEAYCELAAFSADMDGLACPSYDGKKFVQWSAQQFDAFIEDVAALQHQIAKIGVPQRHPFWGSKKTVYNAALKPDIQKLCRRAGAALNAVRTTSAELAHLMNSRAPTTSEDVIRLVRSGSRALDTPDLHGIAVHNEKWESSMEDLAVILETGARLSAIRKKYERILMPEAWHQEVMPIRQALVAHSSKSMRFLIGEYRKARDRLARLCRDGMPDDQAQQLRLVNNILETQRLQKRLAPYEPLASALFGRQWQGIDSNWSQLDRVSSWLIQLHQDVQSGVVNADLLDFLVKFPDLERLRSKAEGVARDFNAFLEAARRAARAVDMEDALEMSKRSFGKIPLSSLLSLFAHWEKHVDSLQDIVAFNAMAVTMREKSMGDVVRLGMSWSESARHLTRFVKAARYTALLTEALRTRKALSRFDSELHDVTIQRYRELDDAHLEAMGHEIQRIQAEGFARRRAPSKVYHALIYEMGESPKRPLSELMADAGPAVQQVKPVFLMTPASVASLLSQSAITFDLVVFEEAGRLSVTDALGAIARSSQLVAIGDSKQGLPSRFFDRSIVRDSKPKAFSAGDDSLLLTMKQRGAAKHHLTWRVTPGALPLVQWVNTTCYGAHLSIYPPPSTVSMQERSCLHRITETDEEGSTSRNLFLVLIDALLQQMADRPAWSFGVVVQSSLEVEAVEWELERRRREDPSNEVYLKQSHEEAFFVKTIEQAQGERRDVLFVGLPFRHLMVERPGSRQPARDADAVLNPDEVQRQICILAWSCKMACHVYTDVTEKEMAQWSRILPGLGLWARCLKSLAGSDPVTPSSHDPSPFQKMLVDALRKKGYETEQQVGVSGIFIDVAVKHPHRPGGYILGIVSDGPVYWKAPSVRDRDVLYPQLLERRGWRIYRVWSVDWSRNPEAVVDRICAHIEALLDAEGSEEDVHAAVASTAIHAPGVLSAAKQRE